MKKIFVLAMLAVFSVMTVSAQETSCKNSCEFVPSWFVNVRVVFRCLIPLVSAASSSLRLSA